MIDFAPKIYRRLFPSVTFDVPGNSVYLTFDDGPNPRATSKVLAVLNKFGVKACFFLLGRNAKEYPALVRAIADDGHTIGNHSFNHSNLVFRRKDFVRREIVLTNEVIKEACGSTPTLFRPPFGFFDLRTLNTIRSLGMRLVHWTNDTRDFEPHTNETHIGTMAHRIGKGSIILLHDNDATSGRIESVLPALIRSLLDRGHTISPLDERCLN